MERGTVEVYERRASEWAARRPPKHRPRARELAARSLPGLPRIDLGCGHGPYLKDLSGPAAGTGGTSARSSGSDPVVALDAAEAMLELARLEHPRALAVRADLELLPFRDRSLGAAWARNSYVHLPEARLPLALARLHWALAPGAPLAMSMLGQREGPVNDDFPGRFFGYWEAERLGDVVVGAGFDVDTLTADADVTWMQGRRARTLPDTVGAGMRVLVCGLNPSVVAADAGYGYAGPTNRFWPAVQAAGLIRHPRRPLLALERDGVGMTDLVKRATARASLLSAEDYRAGAERVRRLVAWLRPGLVLFVGLEGWRAAIDRRARPGQQPEGFGGVPAYVMPSTSGLNAHARMDDLVAHVRLAMAVARDGPGHPVALHGGEP